MERIEEGAKDWRLGWDDIVVVGDDGDGETLWLFVICNAQTILQ